MSFCESPNWRCGYTEQNILKKSKRNIAKNPNPLKMKASVAEALNAEKSPTYSAVCNRQLKYLKPKQSNETSIETEKEQLKVVLHNVSAGKLRKMMTTMSEGDADTTHNIYIKAPPGIGIRSPLQILISVHQSKMIHMEASP